MISEDFLCEECGYRSSKPGNCPRCDAELSSLKETEIDLYDNEEDEEADGDFAFDDDFDFSDEAMTI